MKKLQFLAFAVAGLSFIAWLLGKLDFELPYPSLLLWAAIIAFAIGFGVLIFEYGKAVAAEDAEHG